MSTMGKYCKAYSVDRLKEFKQWQEDAKAIKKETQRINGKEEMVERELSDSDYLYLQENFTVTDGIFLDENIIFDNVTPAWIEFCENALEFKVPVYEIGANQSSEAVAKDASTN